MLANDNERQRFEDIIQPFLIDATHLHGRFVRLNQVVDTILTRHDYPEHVSQLLGEQLVLTALLSRALKHEGIITFQVRGDGPIKLMVTDVTAYGELRGYADLDPERMEELTRPQVDRTPLSMLFGQGYLCITVDHGMNKSPYQGIVELTGKSLSECCLRYLHQSEQFKVHIKTTISKTAEGWQAGGILVQRLPEEAEQHQIILPAPMEQEDAVVPEEVHESWERTCIFVDTLTEEEMLSPTLPPSTVLYRLFHEEGVWVYDPADLTTGCRCTRERIEGLLRSMSEEDITDLAVDGTITVTCQFCNKDELFEQEALKE